MKSGWQTKTLGEVCEIYRGGSPRPIKDFITTDPSGINWIKIGDVSPDGKYIDKSAEKIIPSGIKHSRSVERGDFLLSNSMSFGRPYICRIDGCIHDGWLVLKKIDSSFIPDFLYYLLRSPSVSNQFDFLATGSTVRNLNRDSVSKITVPIPSFNEQSRIVGILDTAFEKIDTVQRNAERNLANAKELFQRVLDEEMTGFSSFLPLKDICTITTGRLNANAAVVGGKYPFFTCSRDVYRIDSYSFDCEALLLAGNNASGDFNVKYFNGKFDAYQRTYVIHGFKDYSPEFLFHILQYNLSMLKSLSLGANTRFLKIGMIENILLPKIPIKQQKNLATKISRLCDFCRADSEKTVMIRRKCLDLKQKILTSAFIGEL